MARHIGGPPPASASSTASSAPIFDDPLAAILGPGSNTKLLGNEGDEVPEEIAAIFAEHGLSDCKYRVILKQVPDGVEDTARALPFIKSWTRTIPTIDYIGREFGPGTYQMLFLWTRPDTAGNGNPKSFSDHITVTVSDKFEPEYRKYQFEKKMKDITERQAKVRSMKIEGSLEASMDPLISDGEKKASSPPIEEAAIHYVDKVASMAERLGMTRKQGFDWDKILPILITAIPAVMKLLSDSRRDQSGESQKFITMMLGMMSQNNNQLIEVLRGQQTPRGADLTREMFDMIKGAIDVKEMIADHGKESVTDRIFNLIAQVAPQILEVARLSAAQRQGDPRFQMARMYAQNNQDVKEAQHSPEVAAELYAKLDATFGWRQADVVLGEVGGVPRPDQCPRDPAMELPADQRNTSPAEAQYEDAGPSMAEET